MSDEISTPPAGTPTGSETAPATPKSRKKLIAIVAASALVLAAGVTVISISSANAAADEVARQCTTALKDGAAATTAAKTSIETADAALETVKGTVLPADVAGTVHTSTSYAGRPAVDAVAAVTAVEASEGSEAVAAVEAVAARKSGGELIRDVTADRAALAKAKIPTECVERDEAETIAALVTKSGAALKTLDTSVKVLLADFDAFQVGEAARIAAEIEAARVAAEAEAARIAAEAAAAADAARIAAEQAAAEDSYYDDSDSDYSGGGGGGGPSGGGGIGLGGDNGGVCWTSNGMGGTMPC